MAAIATYKKTTTRTYRKKKNGTGKARRRKKP